MLKNEVVYLSFGSNVGKKKDNIAKAKKALLKLKIAIDKESSFYKTEPGGNKDQDFFINQVVRIRTSLTPLKLLIFIKNIELKLGRTSFDKWGPREIDIDILFYNDIIVNTPQLYIPHPEIPNRKFVLVPFCEIVKKFIHPGLKVTVEELLKNTTDTGSVEKMR